MTLAESEVLAWLHERDERRLQTLWERADQVRRANVGDEVHLRGLVEISNYCDRECLYCGLRLPNLRIQRYRMSPDEILAAARQALDKGYGSVVLQSGEDEGFETESLCEIVRRIKQEASLAVTLSLGERSLEDLARLRSAGADRYLLRFETSNRELLAYIHPPRAGSIGGDRIGLLAVLRDLGYGRSEKSIKDPGHRELERRIIRWLDQLCKKDPGSRCGCPGAQPVLHLHGY